MAGSSYPGMAQPFSMTHGPTNMSAGMRQEGMSRLFIYLKKKTHFFDVIKRTF